MSNEVHALVWSFTNQLTDDPYVVKRQQSGRRAGWSCTCPYHVNQHASCKHITAVIDALRGRTTTGREVKIIKG